MSKLTDLIDRSIAVWNETAAERRRALIAQTWTESASYVDPAVQSEVRAGIDAMVQAVQQRFPGHRFSRASDVDTHDDRVRFAWELAAAGAPALVDGTDFGVVAANDRLREVTGCFDRLPPSSSRERG